MNATHYTFLILVIYGVILLGALVIQVLLLVSSIVGLKTKVPFVPSGNSVVRKMIEFAGLRDGDTVYDIGCGDGRLLFEARKHANVEAFGFEIMPLPFVWAKLRAWWTRDPKIHILFQNFFEASIHDADVVFCYLMPETLEACKPKFQKELSPKALIVSHDFQIPGWKPFQIEKISTYKTIYLYHIPQ